MEKQYYLPTNDPGKLAWLNNFKNKLPAYAAKYNIAVNELEDVAATYLDFQFRLNLALQVAAYSKQCTAYKNLLRDPADNSTTTAQLPIAPDFSNVPPQVQPGAFVRIAALVKRIIRQRRIQRSRRRRPAAGRHPCSN